jgi:signal transduction histidine kinase
MVYTDTVNKSNKFSDAVLLIRFAAILWVAYLAAMALIGRLTAGIQDDLSSLYYYYALLGAVALVCLGLSYWSWLQQKVRRLFIPIIVTIITVLPIVFIGIIARSFPPSRMLDPQNSLLTELPFLLVGFLLIAWQYKWPYMLIITLGITVLNFGTIWMFRPPGNMSVRGPLMITLIQAVVVLAVSFSISYLMTRMRRQQRSLEDANLLLSHYASTLEQLATSRERNRLARELHDTLAHTLSGLSVQLETVKAYWDVDHSMAKTSLEKALKTARSGLEETRRALKSLRASPLDDLGLVQSLRGLAEEAADRAHLNVSIALPKNIETLTPDIEQSIYRITQEAITNVINHANAKNLKLEMAQAAGKITLLIRDDGVGFDPEKANKTSQFGLTGMKERAQLSGGELIVTSQPGGGTAIKLTI